MAFGSIGHLSRRFVRSLKAWPLPDEATRWVDRQLLPGERDLWAKMSVADQSHAYGVARTTMRTLGSDDQREVMAAALLHDVGKLESGYGTLGRVYATIASKAGVASGRVDDYVRHNEIGAEMLAAAGSDPLTIAWAREHELSSEHWTLPSDISAALAAADNE